MLNKKIKRLKEIRIFKTIITNLKYLRIIKSNGKHIIIEGKVYTKIDKSARINLNGNLRIGEGSYGNSKETTILMEKNSELISEAANIGYDCDIKIFENGKLKIGNSFINSGGKVRCQKAITIGDSCAIGTDVTIMDSNFHEFNGNLKTEEISIKDHVWIGTRVTILNGVTIGEGSVIAANSLVNKDVPPNTLVGGVPAKILKENINWGKGGKGF